MMHRALSAHFLSVETMRGIRKRIELYRDALLPRYRKTKLTHIVPVAVPLVVINQAPRSGGTLLSQLFDGHPQCFVHPHELMWGNFRAKQWPVVYPYDSVLDVFLKLDQPWIKETLDRGFYQKGRAGKVRDHLPFAFDRALQKSIFMDRMANLPPKNARNVLNHYLTSFFNAWLDYQSLYAGDKKYVIAFSPEFITNDASVKAFFRDYPDGYLISIVRHPRSWLVSRLAHTKLPEERRDEKLLLAEWIGTVRHALGAKRLYKERVIIVLFEDLLKETAKVMQEISKIIGIEYDSVLTGPTFNNLPIGSNSSFSSKKSVDQDPVARDDSSLPEPIRTYIAEACEPLYKDVERQINKKEERKHVL